MIDIITVVSSIGNRIPFFNTTSTPAVILHVTFCGADQDNQCVWEWSEGLAPRQETQTITLTCVSLQSDCGFCKSSFKWHIKTGFVVYPVSSRVIHSFQMRTNANLLYKDAGHTFHILTSVSAMHHSARGHHC